MSQRRAAAAATAIVTFGLSVGAAWTAVAASSNPAPHAGSWKTSGELFTGAFKIKKHGHHYKVKGFTGTWTAGGEASCGGAGSFTLPTQTLHIVQYLKHPVWAVGDTGKGGIKPVSVVVTRDNDTTVKAKLVIIFKTPDKYPVKFGNIGELRLSVGSCDASFKSHQG